MELLLHPTLPRQGIKWRVYKMGIASAQWNFVGMLLYHLFLQNVDNENIVILSCYSDFITDFE